MRHVIVVCSVIYLVVGLILGTFIAYVIHTQAERARPKAGRMNVFTVALVAVLWPYPFVMSLLGYWRHRRE